MINLMTYEKLTSLFFFLKKYRFVVFLFIFFLAIIIIFSPTNTVSPNIQTKPQQTVFPSLSPTSTFNSKTIQFLSASPEAGIQKIGNSQKNISFYFNKQISLEDIQIEVVPFIDIKINKLKSSPQRINIYPKTPWVTGETYEITIKKGSILSEDVVLKYTIQPSPPNTFLKEGI